MGAMTASWYLRASGGVMSSSEYLRASGRRHDVQWVRPDHKAVYTEVGEQLREFADVARLSRQPGEEQHQTTLGIRVRNSLVLNTQ